MSFMLKKQEESKMFIRKNSPTNYETIYRTKGLFILHKLLIRDVNAPLAKEALPIQSSKHVAGKSNTPSPIAKLVNSLEPSAQIKDDDMESISEPLCQPSTSRLKSERPVLPDKKIVWSSTYEEHRMYHKRAHRAPSKSMMLKK